MPGPVTRAQSRSKSDCEASARIRRHLRRGVAPIAATRTHRCFQQLASRSNLAPTKQGVLYSPLHARPALDVFNRSDKHGPFASTRDQGTYRQGLFVPFERSRCCLSQWGYCGPCFATPKAGAFWRSQPKRDGRERRLSGSQFSLEHVGCSERIEPHRNKRNCNHRAYAPANTRYDANSGAFRPVGVPLAPCRRREDRVSGAWLVTSCPGLAVPNV